MAAIVSLEDFLGTFDFSKRKYSIFDAYNAYQSLNTRKTLTSISNTYNVPIGVCSKWRSGKDTPYFINHIKALEEHGLLPFYEDAKVFPYVKELFLYSLLSGSIRRERGCNNYALRLFNDEDKLWDAGSVLEDVFDVKYQIFKQAKGGGFMLGFTSKKDSEEKETFMGPALTRLLVSCGHPLGKKQDYVFNVPSFVDVDTFLYYAFKLRGGNHHSARHDMLTYFNIIVSNFENANASKESVLDTLSESGFDFTGYLVHDNRYSKDEGWGPRIHVKGEQVKSIDNFLDDFTPLFFV